MTDQFPPPTSQDPASTPPLPPAPPAPPAAAYIAPPAYGAPIGKVRSTGTCILLFIVTFGIYGLVWFFKTHEEMKVHSGRGLGGLVALLLDLFVGFVMPFFTASEVGQLQEAAGRPKTVQGTTGLWILLPIAGAIVWFVKTNGALNEYWKSLGAPA